MQKRVIIFAAVLIVLLLIVGRSWLKNRPGVAILNVTPTQPVQLNESLISDITLGFSQKYKKLQEDIQITVSTASGKFAKGKMRYKGEMGEIIWFAAKVNDKWILAADGQGPMSCDTAEKYKFSIDFVPMCIMQDGELNTR